MSTTPWGNETQFFYELTPDRILSAVESAGFACTGRCLALNSMENRVFEIELDIEDPHQLKSRYDQFKIIKFYRPGRWTLDQIQDEHNFLMDLNENDVPVVPPIQLDNGRTIGKLKDAEIYYSIFPKVGGRSPEEMTDEQLQITARLLARLHNVGATKTAKHRIEINQVTYGINNLKFLLDQKIIPIDFQNRYKKAVEEICLLSEPLFNKFEKIRLHGDCHMGNLLWSNQGPFWVDFDDMVTGPAIQDIWLVVPGRDEFSLNQREVFLQAYEMMRSFDRESLSLLEPLRTLRFVHFTAWISKRWKDPSFPKAFPQFNTWEYWNTQVTDLEEQLRFIQNPFYREMDIN